MEINIKKIRVNVHIPFCVSKCHYCDFCSFVASYDQMAQYVNTLCQEIEYRAQEFGYAKIKTIYIGGGTPSVLPEGCIAKILDSIKNNFVLADDTSITIEGNPNSLTLNKLKEYHANGINRLSIGLQTTNPRLLKLLNRAHNLDDFVQAVKNARDVGFDNISADMIIGIPTQTIKDVDDTLDVLLKQKLEHISAYGLILEKDTPLYQKVKRGELNPLDDETQNKMYDFVVKKLKDAGLDRYEISNFAVPGYESQHNINYWKRGQYLGVGLDAYSFVHGLHWQNTNNIKEYLCDYKSKHNQEIETIYTAKLETIMLGLRMDKGPDLLQFNKDFATDFVKEYNFVLENLLHNNFVKIENDHLIIIDKHISNAIIQEFA